MAESKTFMDYLAPDSVKGADLMGIDQAARQAQGRQDERMQRLRKGGVYAMPTAAEMKQGQKDYEYVDTVRQRLRPGGGNFDPDDTMC